MSFISKILDKVFDSDGDGKREYRIPILMPAEDKPEAMKMVDVVSILDAKKAGAGQDLDWQKSIVDLMKLLGLDSSLSERKELALELGYPAADIESKGSAEMNIWLHKQVLHAVAANGGNVPEQLYA